MENLIVFFCVVGASVLAVALIAFVSVIYVASKNDYRGEELPGEDLRPDCDPEILCKPTGCFEMIEECAFCQKLK